MNNFKVEGNPSEEKENKSEEDIPLEKRLGKREGGIKLLVKAISEIKYLDVLSATQGHFYSKNPLKYKAFVEYKLTEPAFLDYSHMKDSIKQKTTRNGLRAKIVFYEEEYKKKNGTMDTKYGIRIEPPDKETNPVRMRKTTDYAIKKIKDAVRDYTRRNPASRIKNVFKK